MVHEFRELIPVVTPLGEALALLVECNNHDNWWTVILRDSGAVFTYPQQEILIHRNHSLGIAVPSPEKLKDVIDQFQRASRRFHADAADRPPTTVIHGDFSQGPADEGPHAGSEPEAG